MKYLSTFTGIGGFELAIESEIPNAECVGYSEFDKDADATYLKNFPHHNGLNLGDIERLVFDVDSKGRLVVNEARVKLLPDFDCLVGGPPCQDLSINKMNREGLTGKKSRLFYAFLAILKIKKPRHFIMENVATMPKDAKATITKLISEAVGYEVTPREICSSLVSAQQRPRIYWSSVIPEMHDAAYEVVMYRGGVPVHAWSKSVRPDGSFDERIRKNGKSNALTCAEGGTESIVFFPEAELDFKPRKVWDRKELFYHQIKPEWKLTPEEREWLQGFPRGYTEGVSRAKRVKQTGNAVTVPVIKLFTKAIKRAYENSRN